MSVNISLIVLKKINYILMIFVEIFHVYGWFLLPGSGSVSLKRIRIRLIKMKRIQTDPQHCFLEFLTFHFRWFCFLNFPWFFATRIRNRVNFMKRIRIRIRGCRNETDPENWFQVWRTSLKLHLAFQRKVEMRTHLQRMMILLGWLT